MADLKEVSSSKCFGGFQKVFSHTSLVCRCPMVFSIFIPPIAVGTVCKLPVIYNLAGLTCTVDTFITKSGFQKYAAQHNVVVVSPDVSPRDTGLPGESDDNRMYGHGAGWYLDAMTPGWKDHYNMFSYVTQELIKVIENNFAFVEPGRRGIMGHSMGGHGALLCALKRPGLYQSVSSLSPVASGSTSGGIKDVFEKYLGPDPEVLKEWDACELIKKYKGPSLDILVDIGSVDHHWESLKVWELVRSNHGKDNININLKTRAGYDHDYHFVSSVIGFHIKYHVEILKLKIRMPS